MGSTYVVGHRVATAVDEWDGKVYAAMFEESYESNVHPRTPRWGARSLGSAEHSIRIAVAGSADAEGGMLKGRSGPTTPTAFIRKWRAEFAKPRALLRHDIKISFRGGFSGAKPEMLEAARKVAQQFGIAGGDRADALLLPNVPGQLTALAALIRERASTGVLPWHALNVTDCGDQWGPPVSCAERDEAQPEVSVWLLPEVPGEEGRDRNHVIRIGDKTLQTGWAY